MPRLLQNRAVRLAHKHPLNGHRGIMATYRSIAREYSWKGLFTEVLKFCRACESCQSRRVPRGDHPSLKRPISEQAFHTVASDFSRVLGQSTGKERCRYFLVFVDELTKSPIVVPVKATTMDELFRFIESYVMPHHGYMETLSQIKRLHTPAKR